MDFGMVCLLIPTHMSHIANSCLSSTMPHVPTIEAHLTLVPCRDRFLLLGCDGVWERWSHKVRLCDVNQRQLLTT